MKKRRAKRSARLSGNDTPQSAQTPPRGHGRPGDARRMLAPHYRAKYGVGSRGRH